MPTNLPPEYHEVEKKYKAAATPAEKIRTLEELISTIPKHKGTDKLRADFRRRLSKLKAGAEHRKGTSRQESPYRIPPEGAGQAVVIGHANVGKSALIASLTNADPEVSAVPFTTWRTTIPRTGATSTCRCWCWSTNVTTTAMTRIAKS